MIGSHTATHDAINKRRTRTIYVPSSVKHLRILPNPTFCFGYPYGNSRHCLHPYHGIVAGSHIVTINPITFIELNSIIQSSLNTFDTINTISFIELNSTIQSSLNTFDTIDTITFIELNSTIQSSLNTFDTIDTITFINFDVKCLFTYYAYLLTLKHQKN